MMETLNTTIEGQKQEPLVRALFEYQVERIISVMCEAHGDDAFGLSQDELKLKIIIGFEKALKYGFSLDEHIIEFIELTFVWGDDFDTSEKTQWASEILSWKNTSNDARIKGLIVRSEHELDRKLDTNQDSVRIGQQESK